MAVNMDLRKEKGVTLLSLVITVLVLLIIGAIGIYSGREIIQEAKLESLKTNMLLIQAKMRGYVEQANFEMSQSSDADEVRTKVYINEAKMIKLSDADASVRVAAEKIGLSTSSSVYYYLDRETLNSMGLSSVALSDDGGYYIVELDEQEIKVEVYNTNGYKDSSNNVYYSLFEIEEL